MPSNVPPVVTGSEQSFRPHSGRGTPSGDRLPRCRTPYYLLRHHNAGMLARGFFGAS